MPARFAALLRRTRSCSGLADNIQADYGETYILSREAFAMDPPRLARTIEAIIAESHP